MPIKKKTRELKDFFEYAYKLGSQHCFNNTKLCNKFVKKYRLYGFSDRASLENVFCLVGLTVKMRIRIHNR